MIWMKSWHCDELSMIRLANGRIFVISKVEILGREYCQTERDRRILTKQNQNFRSGVNIRSKDFFINRLQLFLLLRNLWEIRRFLLTESSFIRFQYGCVILIWTLYWNLIREWEWYELYRSYAPSSIILSGKEFLSSSKMKKTKLSCKIRLRDKVII